MAEPVIKWLDEGWRDGAYILGYYVDGVKHCTMKGYPDYKKECFRVYPHKIAPFSAWGFPKVKYVMFREVKRS